MGVNTKEVHNLYVGTSSGVLKGVHVRQDDVSNDSLHGDTAASHGHAEISRLAWGDGEHERLLLLGLRRRAVVVYDTASSGDDASAVVMQRQLEAGSGDLVGLGHCHGSVLTAVESGVVTLWNYQQSQRVHIDTVAVAGGGGRDAESRALSCIAQHPRQCELVACGGREIDVQLWDLQRADAPLFVAKNVRPDMLDLRVPVWVSGVVFLSDDRCIASCHRHSFVRVYDTNSGQRRPVLSISGARNGCDDGEPFTCITTTNHQRQVVVGSGRGRLDVYDVRMCGAGGGLVHTLKGMAGGVRDIACHHSQPLVASVSLDRFLRVHRLDNKQLLHKVYLKSQLNCVLMRSSFDLQCASTLPDPTPDHSECGTGEITEQREQVDRVKSRRKLPRLLVRSDAADEIIDGNSKPKLPKLLASSKKRKRKLRKY